MFRTSYCLNAPHIVSEEFDDEYVVLNLAVGTYYSFQGSGNLLWKALVTGARPDAILEAIGAGGNPDADACRAFLQRVIELELVRATGGADAAELPRDLGRSLASIDTRPVVEVFDDLADFLLADPIHDADVEKGWPVAKPASP
jgi:hypothetical protein